MLIRALKLEKNNGTKRNQETFRIDKTVRLIASNYAINAINRG